VLDQVRSLTVNGSIRGRALGTSVCRRRVLKHAAGVVIAENLQFGQCEKQGLADRKRGTSGGKVFDVGHWRHGMSSLVEGWVSS
jgi:hypothetical protein